MKRYSATVIQATADSLLASYWYKQDLRGFLLRTGNPRSYVDVFNWKDDYKRTIVNELMNRLSSASKGQEYITAIIDGLLEQDESFPHLRRLREDGVQKAESAQNAQRELKQLLGQQGIVDKARQARGASRAEAERQADEVRERENLAKELNQEFLKLVSMTDPRKRGREFEKLLYSLFRAHELDPRGGYSAKGEQTDGSIHIDGKTILVEARWENVCSSPRQIREFRAKVQDKLETTLGLYVAMAGFTDEAVLKAADGGRRLLILMDGKDLAPVFQGLVDFNRLLRDKIRHAAETGEPLYRVQ